MKFFGLCIVLIFVLSCNKKHLTNDKANFNFKDEKIDQRNALYIDLDTISKNKKHFEIKTTFSVKIADNNQKNFNITDDVSVIYDSDKLLFKKSINDFHDIEIFKENKKYFIRDKDSEFRLSKNISYYSEIINDSINSLDFFTSLLKIEESDFVKKEINDNLSKWRYESKDIKLSEELLKVFRIEKNSNKLINHIVCEILFSKDLSQVNSWYLLAKVQDVGSNGTILSIEGNFLFKNSDKKINSPKYKEHSLPEELPIKMKERFISKMESAK